MSDPSNSATGDETAPAHPAASQLRIVLVGTQHPGNIGSAARAMKTMGLSKLVLVAPEKAPDRDTHAMAAGADDLIEAALVFATLAEAVADCRWVLGCTARSRRIQLEQMHPRDAAGRAVLAAAGGPVALVFGRERTGLDNEELQLCHAAVHIPSDPAFSSLNLAAAVQVLSYELRCALLGRRVTAGHAGAQETGDERRRQAAVPLQVLDGPGGPGHDAAQAQMAHLVRQAIELRPAQQAVGVGRRGFGAARLRDADRLGVGDAVCGGPVGGLPLGDGGVREAGAASSGRRREDDAVAGHRQHGGDVLCGQPAGESTEKPDEDGDEGDHGADEDESAAGEAEVAKRDEHEGPFWSPVLVTLPLSPLLPGASSAVCTPFQGRTMACRILLSDDAR